MIGILRGLEKGGFEIIHQIEQNKNFVQFRGEDY